MMNIKIMNISTEKRYAFVEKQSHSNTLIYHPWMERAW